MRWRTVDEVKAGKGEKVCANVSCCRVEDLQPMEVAFRYVEDGKWKSVLVKCVACERCRRKMRRAEGKDKERRSSRRHEDEENERKRRRHHHRKEKASEKSEKLGREGSLRGEEKSSSPQLRISPANRSLLLET